MAKKADKSAKARDLKLVSFEIKPDKWQAFRIHAIKSDLTASELIRMLIDDELKAKRMSK